MRRAKVYFLSFVFFILLPLFYSYSQERKVKFPVVIDAEKVNFLQEEKKVIAQNNVRIKYEDIKISCDKAIYDAENNKAHLEGNIKISSPEGEVFASYAEYDFDKKQAEIKKMRIESPPFYGEAKKAEKIKEKYILKKGYITTCNLKNPHYRLEAKRIIIYPKEKIKAKSVVLFIGKIPVFYFPCYVQSLKEKSFPFQISGGKSKDWGYYLLTRYRYYFSQNNKGKLIFDEYEERGEGFGLIHSLKNSFGEALLKLYYIEDEFYKKDKLPSYVPYHRYSGEFSYNFRKDNLSLIAEFNKFSDKDFKKDFFYREYEKNPHPLSYLLFDYHLKNSSFSLLVQKRANRFFEETEYLPKIEYNFYKQRISKSFPLYFQSKTSFSNLTKKRADSSSDDDSLRFYTQNIFSLSSAIKWLRINPYVGGDFTYYSKNIYLEDTERVTSRCGIDLSTKLYKIFDADFNIWGEKISKMRHTITPILKYEYIHPPTVSSSHLFQFDEIDNVSGKDSLYFTLENIVEAKNDKRKWTFLYFSPTVEYKIKEKNKGSHFDNLKIDLEIYPKRNLSLDSDFFYDFNSRAFKEANVDLGVIGNRYKIFFGHRYARKESSQSTLSFYYKISPKWEFKNYLRYEFKEGRFREQQYILRRDLHCWLMDIGLDIDKEKNLTFWIVFRIKAFPKIHFGLEHTYHGARKAY